MRVFRSLVASPGLWVARLCDIRVGLGCFVALEIGMLV